MGYRQSKHYNAVLKLIREKKFILQTEATKRFNTSTIQTAVEQLTNEGKIKRKKVGVRYKNGNLNYQWLLYFPGTDLNEILEYEKELINRPFESPLKEHHCYKMSEHENTDLSITESPGNNHNVIDMAKYIEVNNTNLTIKEYNNQRIVTFEDVDNIHQRPKGTTKRNFRQNNHRLIEGTDYVILKHSQKDEIRTLVIPNRGITVLTETGYMMVVKSFTDDLSWQVQRQLVNTYFKMKEHSKQNEIAPIPQNEIQSLDILEMMIKEMKKQNERVDNLENKLNTIVKVLSQ